MRALTVAILRKEAALFARKESAHAEPTLYGVTDGKAIGTSSSDASATGDYTTTKRLREMLRDGANRDDLLSYLTDRNLPLDELEAHQIVGDLLRAPPAQGYLTVSNALQWRLQYGRAIAVAGVASGVSELRGAR